ncbi:MAG: hypothetical protein B6226_01395 [Candidatus Cloacimonetes bacterium 4572_65]|nr:MAG: hypothetical protein B6226_01395 [Candidatus Cloacimonetes bacterium 4572_65]
MGRSKRTINLGLYSNVILAILKTVVGMYAKSQALIADGINSTSDVAYYLAIKIFMKKSAEPADQEHPYGHRQLESISAIVVGAFIVTTGASIFWNAVTSIYQIATGFYSGSEKFLIPLIVAGVTVILKIWLYFDSKKAYVVSKNPTIKAIMNDHINDLLASLTVLISISLTYFFSDLYWIDPVAGGLVALFILKTGFEIVMESSTDLMDSIPDPEFREEVTNIILENKDILGVSHIGIHKYGPQFVLNITIEVDSMLTVRDGDFFCDKIECALYTKYIDTLKKVNIHYHPPKAKLN